MLRLNTSAITIINTMSPDAYTTNTDMITSKIKSSLAAVGLLCLNQFNHANAAEPANFGEYTQMLQYEMVHPTISYCAVKVPATKKDLEAEFELFKEKTRVAMEPLLGKIGAEELAKPVPPDSKATFKAMGDQMLDGVKKLDPKAYCPFLVGSLRKTTAESLRVSIETQYTRYEQKAKDAKDAKDSKPVTEK
jgi:hypothetical protein